MMYTIIVLTLVIILNILATRKLLRSVRLLKRTKRIHVILVWIIPFIWALLVLLFSDEPPKKNKKFDQSRYMRSGYQSYISHHFSRSLFGRIFLNCVERNFT